MNEIQTLLDRKTIRARVEAKTNAKGEIVIGVILAKDQPGGSAL